MRIGVDLERLARAVHLHAEPNGDDAWMVSGDRSYLVREGVCSCADAAYRGIECKHRLAIRLAVLDPDIREALQLMIPGRGSSRLAVVPRTANAGAHRG